MSFAKDFVWGVATAAYQIEGGAYEGDKGLNGWDVGSRTPGRVFEGHSGDVGCDHFHHMEEDVALMQRMGVKNYRFSVNWARVMPHGTGEVSAAGAQFYIDLLKELRRAGITPWVTLFHWDYPYELQCKGGWLNPESPAWFENYCRVCAELFGGYTDNFILINEPQCFVELGHFQGTHAPFLRLSRAEALACAHNVLLGFAKGEKAVRAVCKRPVKIGFAQAFGPAMPYTEADTELARRDTFACHNDLFSGNFWVDPLVFGHYPEEFLPWMAENGFTPPADDLKCQIDFYGVNTYTGRYVTAGKNGEAVGVTPKPSVPKTDMRWDVFPDSLYWGAKFLYERYRLPIIYTENGVALTEWKTLEGTIDDDCRVDFIKRYLRSLHRAAQEVDVKGYFYWSFMDNFEWAEGFSKKFGLIHVDYDTLVRTPKKSAFFYKKVMESNGEEIFK